MKNFFTLLSLAVLAGAGANAAEFLTIKVDGNQVKNGDVIISNKLEIDEFEGEIWGWELKPDFTIESSEEAVYTLEVTNVGDTTFQFCGVAGASTSGLCVPVLPGNSQTDEGDLEASHSYLVTYDYSYPDVPNVPEKVECKGFFKMEAECDSGVQNIEFQVNMVYDGNNAVEGITGDKFTLIVGNGRVASADGGKIEVYTLSGARVANEGLDGIYVVRIGDKALKVAVK